MGDEMRLINLVPIVILGLTPFLATAEDVDDVFASGQW